MISRQLPSGTTAVPRALSAIRGDFLHFIEDPFLSTPDRSYELLRDGVLLVEDGRVKALGEASRLLPSLPAGVAITHYEDSLIVPGFIDTHVHFPQLGVIASYGEELLEWLARYAFPAEAAFAALERGREMAAVFLDELLRHGTTTAMVFGSSHKASVEALFAEAERRELRLIAGKVLMDRGAPQNLIDTAESGYRDSRALIQKWHGRGRLHYAVTPRFAITSSPNQLKAAGRLLREFPDVYLQTHVSENKQEVARVRRLFPSRSSYVDVYDHFELLGSRSVLAHGVHLREREMARLYQTGSAIAFCPTSNLFLGSGLFPLAKAKARRRPLKLGLGTDVGAGTSLSLLQTMNEAYKVARLQEQTLSPLQCFYLATLGGALALSLEDRLGNFLPGKEADFVVLDRRATPLLRLRLESCERIEDVLFAFAILGDDRAVRATHVLGRLAYARDSRGPTKS